MCTLAGSMIPMALRLFISLDHKIAMFDIKDLLFAGLTMNLSNLNLMSNEFEARARIAMLSGFLIVVISVALGASLINEDSNTNRFGLGSEIVSVTIVLGSIWKSYKTNEYVFSNKKK